MTNHDVTVTSVTWLGIDPNDSSNEEEGDVIMMMITSNVYWRNWYWSTIDDSYWWWPVTSLPVMKWKSDNEGSLLWNIDVIMTNEK